MQCQLLRSSHHRSQTNFSESGTCQLTFSHQYACGKNTEPPKTAKGPPKRPFPCAFLAVSDKSKPAFDLSEVSANLARLSRHFLRAAGEFL